MSFGNYPIIHCSSILRMGLQNYCYWSRLLYAFKIFCHKNNLLLIEDNAHGHGGEVNGQLLGRFGEVGFSSPRKQLNTICGGVLYFNGKINYNLISLKPYPLTKRYIIQQNIFHRYPGIKDIFKKILVFLNQFKKIEINDDKIKDVIELCSFDKLSAEEIKYGFKENQSRENFFRKGLIDEWKNVLTKDQIKIIEDNFKVEMVSLGYL